MACVTIERMPCQTEVDMGLKFYNRPGGGRAYERSKKQCGIRATVWWVKWSSPDYTIQSRCKTHDESDSRGHYLGQIGESFDMSSPPTPAPPEGSAVWWRAMKEQT